MAGANPAILIRVAATISELKANLAEGKTQIETTTAAMQKLAASFSGDKMIQAANNVTAAVNQVGGASKLTEAEMARVNATLTKAIEKYQVLGREAPSAMIDLEKQTRAVQPPTDSAGLSVGKLAASYATAQVAIDFFKSSVRAIIGFITESVKAYGEAEAAQMKLVAALRSQGTATPDVIDKYNELASQFQKTTVFSDDLVNEMQALFVEVGNVGPTQMEKAISAAANLSAGLGIDLQQATMLVAKALEGNTGALKRYGVQIDDSAVKTRGADAVFEALQRRFGGQAIAQADTYTGRVQMMGNAWNNFQEAIGKFLVDDPAVRELLRTATQLMNDLSGSNERASTTVGKLVNAWRGWMELINPGLKIKREQDELNDAIHTTEEQVAALTARLKEQGSPLADLTSKGIDFTDAQRKAQEALEKYDKESAEAKRLAEEHAKAIKGLRDELSGAGLEKDLSLLREAWNTLTPAQRANKESVDALLVKYEAIREHVKASAFPADLERLRAANLKLLESTTPVNTSFSTMAMLMPEVRSANVDLIATVENLIDGMGGVTDKLYEQTPLYGEVKAKIDDVRSATSSWQEDLAALGVGLGELGGQLGGKAGGIIQFAGNTLVAISQLSAAMETLGSASATTAQKVAAGFSAASTWVGLAIMAYQVLSKAANDAAHNRAIEKLGRSLGDAYGETFSRAFLESLNAQNFAGNSLELQLTQLSKIIAETGGVTKYGAEKWTVALKSMLDTLIQATSSGVLSAAATLEKAFTLDPKQAQEALAQVEAIFPQLVKVATEGGGLVSKAFLGIIEAEEKLGLTSAAVTDFITGQLSSALQGLTGYLQTANVASADLAAAQARLAQLDEDYANAVGPQKEKIAAEIAKVTDEIRKQQQIIEVTAVTSESAATGMAAAIVAAFSELQNRGVSVTDALKAVAPAVSALEQQMKAAGLTGGDAFNAIRRYVALASDAVAGPALNAVSALNQAFVGLHNTGLLNQEMFEGLAAQVTDTFNSLVAQGKSGDDIMRLMGPTLQTIWELQQDFGYSVDDATQALLDQATEAGVVGEAHRSAQERIAAAMTKVVETLDRIAGALGAIPPAATSAANGVNDAISRLPKKITIPVDFPSKGPAIPTTSGAPESFAAGSNGFRDFGAGTLAILHGREAVVREGQSSPSSSAADAKMYQQMDEQTRAINRLPTDIARAVRDAALLSR